MKKKFFIRFNLFIWYSWIPNSNIKNLLKFILNCICNLIFLKKIYLYKNQNILSVIRKIKYFLWCICFFSFWRIFSIYQFLNLIMIFEYYSEIWKKKLTIIYILIKKIFNRKINRTKMKLFLPYIDMHFRSSKYSININIH